MKKLFSTLTVLISGLFSLHANAAQIQTNEFVSNDEAKLNHLSEDEIAYKQLLKNIKPGNFTAIDVAGAHDHSRGG